mmetsp:Transcript_32534/g.49777  ORF Transcript_32534/g.49777 Transcript_32534/m.49777 type:complete len:97 (-) Transcript_32534:251-541(-)
MGISKITVTATVKPHMVLEVPSSEKKMKISRSTTEVPILKLTEEIRNPMLCNEEHRTNKSDKTPVDEGEETGTEPCFSQACSSFVSEGSFSVVKVE